MYTTKWIIPVALSTMLAACGTVDDSNEPSNGDPMSGDTRMLDLASGDLPTLGEGYVYEGWIIVDESPVSTGRFSADDGGGIEESFEVSASELEKAAKFVLTIEPAEGDDPAPSAVKFLAGDIVDGETVAKISNKPALGTDFGDATGSYVLAAPSAEEGQGTYANGIWFLDPSGPAPALDLPALPEGWVYEGWVVTDDGPVSTGRFADPAEMDSDGAGPAAGPNDTPPLPGQDFVAEGEQIDIVGKKVVISVEPQPDDSAAPFILKPLIDDVEDVGAKTLQPLENMASAPTLEVSAQ